MILIHALVKKAYFSLHHQAKPVKIATIPVNNVVHKINALYVLILEYLQEHSTVIV